MTNTLLDFSLRPELALHARVVADVEAAAAPMTGILKQQTDSGKPGLLPSEMNVNDPDRAVFWLEALLRGLLSSATPKP